MVYKIFDSTSMKPTAAVKLVNQTLPTRWRWGPHGVLVVFHLSSRKNPLAFT